MAHVTGSSVYLYYAANGRLVYVGVTHRGTQRMHEHADSKPWWHLVTGCAIEHYDTRARALAREKYVISHHRPLFNIQHNPNADLPMELKIASAGNMGTGFPDVGGMTRKQRRKAYAKLTPAQKRLAPCVECGIRPDPRCRGTCPSCLTQPP